MKYNLILENWKQFLSEQDMASVAPTSAATTITTSTADITAAVEKSKDELRKTKAKDAVRAALTVAKEQAKALGKELSEDEIRAILLSVGQDLNLSEAKKKRSKVVKKKKSGDRCTRIAKRKYDVWPSAYASGAVVKCRKGKIWKGISESATDEEIDNELLLEEIEVIEEELDEAKKKKPYKPNFSKEKDQGLHGWFARNKGKGWINCRTGGPCGRDSADSGGKYPACRPTKAQCKSAGKGPLRKKKSSKPISWTKKKNKD
jgi:hypothetical protein